MPAFQSPSATIGCGPICLHASAQDRPFDRSSFTWMRPPLATSEAAVTFREGATFSFNEMERIDRGDADSRTDARRRGAATRHRTRTRSRIADLRPYL